MHQTNSERKDVFVVFVGGRCRCCTLLKFHRHPSSFSIFGRESSNVGSDVGGDGNELFLGTQNRSVKDVPSKLWNREKWNDVSLFRPIGRPIQRIVYACDIQTCLVFGKIVFVVTLWFLIIFGRNDQTQSSDQCFVRPVQVGTNKTILFRWTAQVGSALQ